MKMKQILFIALFAIAAICVKAQDTIYYDNKGKQVQLSNLAAFKSVTQPDSIDKSIFVCQILWASGQKNKEFRYRIENNEPVYVGRFAEWYSSGILKSEVSYTNGKKDGEQRSYAENGNLKSRTIYSSGKYIDELDEKGNSIPFVAVEQMPQFQGGEDALRKFINSNLRYPVYAMESNIQGRVIVRFAVEKNGEISRISVLRGIGGGCDEEAMRIISMMPRWIPGKQGDSPVAVWYTLPITFAIAR